MSDANAEELIECAAILFPDCEIPLGVPAPGTHEDLKKFGASLGWTTDEIEASQLGFTTTRKRFVDQHEAWRIAKAAGQVVRVHPGPPETLCVEHLWKPL